MKFALLVWAKSCSECDAMSRQGTATPGVYQIEKSLQSLILHFGVTSNFPR
jgi:hypothetical protein